MKQHKKSGKQFHGSKYLMLMNVYHFTTGKSPLFTQLLYHAAGCIYEYVTIAYADNGKIREQKSLLFPLE